MALRIGIPIGEEAERPGREGDGQDANEAHGHAQPVYSLVAGERRHVEPPPVGAAHEAQHAEAQRDDERQQPRRRARMSRREAQGIDGQDRVEKRNLF